MGNSGSSNKGPFSSAGYDNLRNPFVNHGLALSDTERDKMGVRGLLPAGQVSLVGLWIDDWDGRLKANKAVLDQPKPTTTDPSKPHNNYQPNPIRKFKSRRR